MVAKAKDELEQELEEKEEQKGKYLEEKVPPVQLTGLSLAELKVDIFLLHLIFVCHNFLQENAHFDQNSELSLHKYIIFLSRHCVRSSMPK